MIILKIFITMAFVMAHGILFGMILRIDKAGRVVVPKLLRERFRLTPDTELEVVERPDGVLLKRVEQSPSMVKIDGLWVHQGEAEPGANWDRVIDDLREERIESVLKA
jgi:AbrB family looped-hinge helix DNA binding protein